MSMFDRKMETILGEFNAQYTGRQYAFRNCLGIVANNDNSIGLVVKVGGRQKEFMAVSQEDYENAIRLPVQCARLGNSAAHKFFAWHWLEEQNKLDLFFNTLKELQNA